MKKAQDILAEADTLHSEARTGRVSLDLYEKAIKLYRQSAEEFLSCKASTNNPDEIKTAEAWNKFALSRAAGDEAAVAYFGPKAGGGLAIVEAKTQEAIGFVNEAIELLPKEVDSDRRSRWQIQELSYRAFMHRGKAEAALDARNFPVAIQQFQTCSENHHKAAELYRQLGMEKDGRRVEGRSHTALRDLYDAKATQAYDAGSEQYASYLEKAIEHAREAVRFRTDWEWWREERARVEEKYRAFHEQQDLRRQFEALGEQNSQLRKQIAGLERKIVRKRLLGLLAGFILGVLASLVARIILSLLGIV